jgi:S-formylglutathione hydrolase FrmB
MRCISSVCQYFLLFLNISSLSGTVSKARQSVPQGDYGSAGQPRGEAGVEDTFGNLCDFNKEIDTFLIANHHRYVYFS